MPSLDEQIDALYRLPAGEFTAARAALAKTLAAPAAAAVKALKKPLAVPWAVNQLYWRDRRTYQRLLDTGRALRAAQVAAIEGRKADVRQAAEAHRASVAAAAARAVDLAEAAGAKPNAEPIARMLEAISLAREQPEHPGRFTEVLRPAAFEALAGITPRATHERLEPSRHAPAPSPAHAHGRDGRAETSAREKRRREEADAAEQRRREQERRAERRALESTLAEAERAAARARHAADEAREALTLAERNAAAADRALDAARDALDAFERARS